MIYRILRICMVIIIVGGKTSGKPRLIMPMKLTRKGAAAWKQRPWKQKSVQREPKTPQRHPRAAKGTRYISKNSRSTAQAAVMLIIISYSNSVASQKGDAQIGDGFEPMPAGKLMLSPTRMTCAAGLRPCNRSHKYQLVDILSFQEGLVVCGRTWNVFRSGVGEVTSTLYCLRELAQLP